jgi:hypothetical protein
MELLGVTFALLNHMCSCKTGDPNAHALWIRYLSLSGSCLDT